MIERVQAADDRSLVECEAQAMPKLQAEGLHLALEAEVLRFRPGFGDQVGRYTGLHHVDPRIDPFARLRVGVALTLRRPADVEGPVVAGAVAVIGLDDVEEGLVAGPDQAIGEDVRVWAAALAGDGIDRLH